MTAGNESTSVSMLRLYAACESYSLPEVGTTSSRGREARATLTSNATAIARCLGRTCKPDRPAELRLVTNTWQAQSR